jgi:hypothetical protein
MYNKDFGEYGWFLKSWAKGFARDAYWRYVPHGRNSKINVFDT